MAIEVTEVPPGPKVSYLRAVLVVVIGAYALAVSLPNVYAVINRTEAWFDFNTCDGVVCSAGGEARKAGIRLGDRVNVSALPLDERYTDYNVTQLPLPGRRVTFPLERGGVKYTATLTAHRGDPTPAVDLLALLAGKLGAIILCVLVSALFLIRPSPLTGSFALYASSSAALNPWFYAFLPGLVYDILMMIGSVFFAAGAVGFLALALLVGRRTPLRARPWLIALSALLVILLWLSTTFALLGFPSLAIYTITYSGMACILIVATATLIRTALRRRARAGERLAAALLAVAGVATVFMRVYQLIVSPALPPSFALVTGWMTALPGALPGMNASFVAAQMTTFLTSAAAAYVIVRDRVVDIGLVRSRILAYGATVVAVLAAFGFLNWGFSGKLAAFPLAVPFEVLTALAAGYWFSGFRDVSNALALAAVDAPVAAMHGRHADEHDALVRALGLADRTRQPSVIAEIRARCAFTACVNGDNLAFERHITASSRALGSKTLHGIKTFVLVATEKEFPCDPGDFPEWQARASLLLCARSSDARRATEHARDAVLRADESGDAWLRVLARVALAESAPSERTQRLNEADAVARAVGSLPLVKSLGALRSDKREIGLLQAFVDVRMRKIRSTCPVVEIAFFTGEVRLLNEAVDLPEKERELLFTVAASNGVINGDLLCDALWPDSDGDAARNALYVCLHRLRKHARDPRIVRRFEQGYALHPGADVDLWRLEAALSSGGRGELERLSQSVRDGAAKRARLGRWFEPFEARLGQMLERVDRVFELDRIRNAACIH